MKQVKKSLVLAVFVFFLFSGETEATVNWESSTAVPKRVAPYHGVAYDKVRQNIFIIGGRVDDFSESPSKEVFKGRINSDLSITWLKQADFPFETKNSAAVYLDGYVYNIGGEDPTNSKVYKSDVSNGEINSWQEIVSLPNSSWRGKALVYQNRIYYLDGIAGRVWRLSPDETSWDNFGTFPKSGFGDFAAGFSASPRDDVDYLYVAGGQTYNPRCQTDKIYKADIRISDGRVLGFAVAGNFPDRYYPDPFNNDEDLDHGIKAYHQIAIQAGKMYVFPAASFSTQESCESGKTNTGSTLRSFVADITDDGRVVDWRIWGPDSESVSNIKVDGSYVNQWPGGFDGLNWVRDGLATNVYGGVAHGDYFFMIGGENYAGHTNQVAYLPLKITSTPTPLPTNTPTPICKICSSGLDKAKGNADCNNVIDLLDFAGWLNVFKTGGSETEKAAVNFDCQESDNKHVVNLSDFQVWLGNYTLTF